MLTYLFQRKPKPPGTLCPENIRTEMKSGITFSCDSRLDDFLRVKGIWDGCSELKLHLGCGRKIFDGYVNIDYPDENHNVMSDIQADVFADILKLELNAGSVSEIRLHHVFEHFDRVTALAQLFRWSDWLKPQGRLVIETPDLEAMAKTFVATRDHRIRMGLARHLAGDQSSPWGYHLEHWWPGRYVKTLEPLSYKIESIATEQWESPPFLSNVVVIARKSGSASHGNMRTALHEILKDSMVNETEEKTFEVWRAQLDEKLAPHFRQSG